LEILIDLFHFFNSISYLKNRSGCYRAVPLPSRAVTTVTAVTTAVISGKKTLLHTTGAGAGGTGMAFA
jgi:hypothetical protein